MIGASVHDDQGRFVVLHDPGGSELGVFPGDPGDALARPFALCVDSARPAFLVEEPLGPVRDCNRERAE